MPDRARGRTIAAPRAAGVSLASTIVVWAAFGACTMAPAYRPPAVQVPASYAGLDSASVAARTSASARDTARLIVADTSRLTARASDVAGESLVRDEPLSSPFWAELGDSALIELVHEALRANPDVRVAESRLRGARATRQRSRFDLVPTVTAQAGYAHQRFAEAQLPGVPSSFREGDLWDAGFDAAWEVDVFGRVRSNVSARNAFVSSAEEDLRDVQVTLAAELARTYMELRGTQEELTVAQQNVANQERTLALTQERLSAGKGTAFDVERARAQVNSTQSAIPLLQAQIAQAQYGIAVLLGRSPEQLPEAVLRAGALPPLPPEVHVGSPKLLVSRRPDVLSAERAYAARTALVSAAQADYLPRFNIVGSVGRTSTALDSLGHTGSVRFLVGPSVSWPLLDLGRVHSQVDEAQAAAEEARASYTSTVLRALNETESSLVAYDRSRARLGNLAEAVQASRRAAELARMRFESGVSDFLQVLDAERTLLEAESQLARGRTDAATALVAVYKAVGGTWPTRANDAR